MNFNEVKFKNMNQIIFTILHKNLKILFLKFRNIYIRWYALIYGDYTKIKNPEIFLVIHIP